MPLVVMPLFTPAAFIYDSISGSSRRASGSPKPTSQIVSVYGAILSMALKICSSGGSGIVVFRFFRKQLAQLSGHFCVTSKYTMESRFC